MLSSEQVAVKTARAHLANIEMVRTRQISELQSSTPLTDESSEAEVDQWSETLFNLDQELGYDVARQTLRKAEDALIEWGRQKTGATVEAYFRRHGVEVGPAFWQRAASSAKFRPRLVEVLLRFEA